MIAYIVWDVSPEIFEGLFFRWYSIFWLLGMFLAYGILLHIYKSEGILLVELDTLIIFLVLGIIAGARVGHILFYDPAYYWNNPMEILPFRTKPDFEFTGLTGLASHGGVIGALLALHFYQRKFGRNYWWILDRITIAEAGLGGFIRLGNLLNSEIIGTPSNLPWPLYLQE
jgi:phosphatidylglycerol---prolipoprotein diacylglyceryl transferase